MPRNGAPSALRVNAGNGPRHIDHRLVRASRERFLLVEKDDGKTDRDEGISVGSTLEANSFRNRRENCAITCRQGPAATNLSG
jgi:hypothetical protein